LKICPQQKNKVNFELQFVHFQTKIQKITKKLKKIKKKFAK
jgi:hypothetical protein